MADDSNASGNAEQQQPTNTNPPQQAVTVQPQNQPSQSGQPFIRELKDSLDALPERLVHALREAMPQQTTTTQTAERHTETASTSAGHSETSEASGSREASSQRASGHTQQTAPGKKSFADWWFGT